MKAYDQKRRNREEFLQYIATYHRDHPFAGHREGCMADKGFTWSSGYSEWVEGTSGKEEYYPIKQVHCKQCKRAFYIEPTGWRPFLEKLIPAPEPTRSSRPGRKRRRYAGLRPVEDLVVDWTDTVPMYHQLISSGQMVLALIQEEADAPFSHLHRPGCSTKRGFYCASSSYEPYAIDNQRVKLRIRVIRCRECRQSFRLVPAAWSRLELITSFGKSRSSVSLPLSDTVEAYQQLVFQNEEFLKKINWPRPFPLRGLRWMAGKPRIKPGRAYFRVSSWLVVSYI
jgi:hypothetical protein